MKTGRWFIAAVAAVTMVSMAQAGVVMTDTFSDGDRAPSDAANGGNWTAISSHNYSFAGSGMTVDPIGSISRVNQTTFTPQTLADGDSLTATFSFRLTASVPSLDRSLRIGLFNSQGTFYADQGGSIGTAQNLDNVGYFAGVSTGGANNSSYIFNDKSTSQMFSTSGATIAGGSNYSFGNINDMNAHDVTMTILRNSASSYDITFGVSGLSTYTRTATAGEFTDTFDLLAIHTSNSALDYEIDDVVITVVPEPATLGLLAVAGAGLVFVRRMKK